MVRQHAMQKEFGKEENFRWRGGEVSRMESFTDAVFAFAVTLLVVSLEVPHSFTELLQKMEGFAAFAVTFTALLGIWYCQYIFFRRYGLQDGMTFVLNAILVFVVLFYMYPLKFLSNLLINHGLLRHVLGFTITSDIEMNGGGWSTLMVIYGMGFLAVFVVFTLLYRHAYRKRHELEMSPIETLITQSSIRAYGLCVAVSTLSILIAAAGGSAYAGVAGWTYALIGPLEAWNGALLGRRIRKLQSPAPV